MMTDDANMDRSAPTQKTDSFGCAESRLQKDQAFVGGNIGFFRKRSLEGHFGQVATPAANRGFLVGVSMQLGHRRRIFHEHHATDHDFEDDAIYIRNFSEAYRADLRGQFDFMLMEIPGAFLETMAEDIGSPGIRNLTCVAGRKDPVIANLMRAMMPAFDRPQEASALFVDQLATAMSTYLLQQYGDVGSASAPRNRSLSRMHESLAKEMMRSRLDGDISIAEVADACNLSRSYFIRAFRETTGQTPHQWLVSQRIERACNLLRRTDAPLAEIAVLCGFADQSHFTRLFSSAMGKPPGNWRRNMI